MGSVWFTAVRRNVAKPHGVRQDAARHHPAEALDMVGAIGLPSEERPIAAKRVFTRAALASLAT
jgi:hypothetical protein